MAGKPKPAFFATVALVVVGLLLFAAYRNRNRIEAVVAPKADQGQNAAPKDIDPSQIGAVLGPEDATNAKPVTTVQEYTFTPSERLPKVEAAAAFRPLENNTVRFALNMWAGWAPIIYANNGLAAGKVWKTPQGEEFRVDLVLIDKPIAMQDAFIAGEVHIGWATLDMLPLFLERIMGPDGKPIDNRVMPRVYQQVDWSNGGDGIVVRENIRRVSDLRGKSMVLAESSPSHYFALNMLVSSRLQPRDVNMIFTLDAFEAAAAFHNTKEIEAVVSWAPDIYNLSDVPGNRMLVDTGTANKLIADVWFARADFAEQHRGILEGLVRGIFDAMVELKGDAATQAVAKLMAEAYNMTPPDAAAMLKDAHSTNWEENRQFFLNQNNPTNFERVWNQAYYLYRQIGKITHPKVPFDQVMDFSIIQELGKEEKYALQKDEYTVTIEPKMTADVQTAEEILTNTVVIHFFPNSSDLYKKVTEQEGDQSVERFYDPSVDLVLEEIAKLAGQFGAARIVVEGHTDSSMKERVPEDMVRALSDERANAVQNALIQKYPSLNPKQFHAVGKGWDVPADPNDEFNQARNRRVEIKIYPLEAGG